jgi:hypothetical protein
LRVEDVAHFAPFARAADAPLLFEDVAHIAPEKESVKEDYAMSVLADAFNQQLYENQRLAREIMFLRSQASVPDYAVPGYWEDSCHTSAWMPWDSQQGFRSPAGFHGSKSQPGYVKAATASMLDDSTEAGSSPRSSTGCSKAPSSDNSLQGDNTRTTVMMRNLPYECTREVLIGVLQDHGYTGMFNLLYLPVDFKFNNVLGYAFINFVSPEIAQTFRFAFAGFQDWPIGIKRVCDVGWSDVQGLEAHVERYRNSPVMHDGVPDEYKPVLFVGSERVPFPKPTKKIRPPRHWNRT